MTPTQRAALEQVLESLLELVPDPQIDFGPAYEGAKQRRKKSIAALRAALAEQPAEQEPVSFIEPEADNDCAYAYADGWNACLRARRHTAPQPAKRISQWIAVSDQLPTEDDGEVLVRMRDGRHEIAWATYWHSPGITPYFAQWTYRDPDENECPTHWQRIEAAYGITGETA